MISTHELSEKVGQAQRFTRVEIFLQQMVNGLVIASVLVLVALGITLIFGLTGIVFFAQGELLMLGGFTVWFTVDQGGNYFLGIVLAASLLLALGFFLERGLMRFTLESPLNGFIVSLGLIIALQHIVILAWGALDKGIARPISALWNVGDVHISATRVFVVGVAAVVVVLYFFVISRTRYGRALRSVAEDREIAAMMGIPVRRYITAVFVVGSATAGLGGALLLALFPVNPFIGANFVIKGFAVALIGGLGNVTGAVIAALLLGLVEAMSAGYSPAPQWTEGYAFVLMILVLLLRPQGILRGAAGARVS